jgi:hypothetical protein
LEGVVVICILKEYPHFFIPESFHGIGIVRLGKCEKKVGPQLGPRPEVIRLFGEERG